MQNKEILIEKIRQDLLHQQEAEMQKGVTWHFAIRKARMEIIDKLVKNGTKHSEAVYLVYKAARKDG